MLADNGGEERQKTIISLHGSSLRLSRVLISVRVVPRLPLKYLKCKEGRFVEKHAAQLAGTSHGRSAVGAFLFKGKVPGAPASWKYHAD